MKPDVKKEIMEWKGSLNVIYGLPLPMSSYSTVGKNRSKCI